MTVYQLDKLKDIRSKIILKHLHKNPVYKGAFILSCGNAYKSLKEMGESKSVNVLGLSTTHPYKDSIQLERRFYSLAELNLLYPDKFNATPGALNTELMYQLGEDIYRKLMLKGYHAEKLYVPVGSGETIVALSNIIQKDNLIGFTCNCYPPIRLDFSLLEDTLKRYNVIKVNALRDVEKLANDDTSVVKTW